MRMTATPVIERTDETVDAPQSTSVTLYPDQLVSLDRLRSRNMSRAGAIREAIDEWIARREAERVAA